MAPFFTYQDTLHLPLLSKIVSKYGQSQSFTLYFCKFKQKREKGKYLGFLLANFVEERLTYYL